MNRAPLLDRYPFNSPWVRGLVARYWLGSWFATNSFVAIVYAARDTSLLYFDARLYLLATQAWLRGEDPWSVSLAGNYFAAPPPSLLPMAPIAVLPIDIGVAVLAGSVILAAVATVRLLDLPWWWLLFPPLVQCVLSANVHALLAPLILVRGGALASLLKVYGAIPLLFLGRWRALTIAALLLLLSVPLLPWASFLSQLALITERLADQTKYALPAVLTFVLVPIGLLAMTVVGRSDAAWLAVPALWPSPQYYYRSLTMPVRSDAVAAVVALPVIGSPFFALIGLAILRWREGRRPAWLRFVRRVPVDAGPSVR